MMSHASPVQSGQTVGSGRFTLVHALGRGGMGEVWLAQDNNLGEQAALKFLPPEVAADPVAINDLQRETARSHRLTHPHIVRIHDFHRQADELAFISMEYVDGPTLSGWRLQQPQQVLSWDHLAPLVQQLCAALDYAHGERVIHRDLKPSNLMVDSRGRLKLADFGIAATVSDSASRVSARSATSGTLLYMSPQQLSGKHPQPGDDLYALGATLYELLTSRPPFYTGDITHQVLREPPEPMDQRLAALEIQNPIPPGVAAVIMACLAKEPDQRPQSAAEMATWLYATGAPLAAEIPSSAEAAEPGPRGSMGSKLKAAGAAGAGVVVLVSAGAVYLAAHRGPKKQAQSDSPSHGSSDPSPASAAAASFELTSRPSIPFAGALPGTVWLVTDSEGDSYCFQFESNGTLNYEAHRGIRPNGRWQQNGSNLRIDINDGYAVFTGVLSGGKMDGNARSRDGKTWNWEAKPKS